MKWNDLTMKEMSDLMSLFLKAGVDSLSDMRHIYDGIQDTEEYSGGTIKPSKISASLSRDQWNNLYKQGKVRLSEIQTKEVPIESIWGLEWSPLTQTWGKTIYSPKGSFKKYGGLLHKYSGEDDTINGGIIKESKISPKLSRKEIRRDTKYKNILNNLLEGDKYTDLQKRRLSEYYARASGGQAIPGLNTAIAARRGLREDLEDGKSVYEHLLYTGTPVESIIDSYNDKNTTIDEYGNTVSTGLINNYDGTIKGEHDYTNYDIVDALFSSKVPYNGRLATTPRLYKNYIESHYKDKKVKSYSYGKSKLDKATLKKLELLSDNSLKDRDKTIVLGAATDTGLPFLLDNGETQVNYDGAGYLIQFVKDGDKIYQRKSDIYDFEPNSYVKRWGRNLNVTKGLTALDKNSTPVVLLNPWEELLPETIKYYNLDENNLWESIRTEKDRQDKQRKKGSRHVEDRAVGEVNRMMMR